MKTPDKTKRALVTCTELVMPKEVQHQAMLDALAYIQQLEAANAELLTKVKRLEIKCHQLERERDAAVGDLHYLVNHPLSAGPCYACAHTKDCYSVGDCNAVENDRWEWRGVKEE